MGAGQSQRLSIDKAIRASQRCQRNWDLTQVIAEEDVKTLHEYDVVKSKV